MTRSKQIVIEAFKREVRHLVVAYGIRKTVMIYGHTGSFAYIPDDVDLVEFLEELFPELK